VDGPAGSVPFRFASAVWSSVEAKSCDYKNEKTQIQCQEIVEEIKKSDLAQGGYIVGLAKYWSFMKTHPRDHEHAEVDSHKHDVKKDFLEEDCIKWRQGENLDCGQPFSSPESGSQSEQLVDEWSERIHKNDESMNEIMREVKWKNVHDKPSDPRDDITRTCFYMNLRKNKCVEVWNKHRDRAYFKHAITATMTEEQKQWSEKMEKTFGEMLKRAKYPPFIMPSFSYWILPKETINPLKLGKKKKHKMDVLVN